MRRGARRAGGSGDHASPRRRAAGAAARLLVLALSTAVATLALASLAIPRLGLPPHGIRARIRVFKELRAIAESQRDVHARGLIDRDRDGIGEYATLAELARRVPLRDSAQLIEPTLQALTPWSVLPDGVVRSGYYYLRLDLPAAVSGGRVPVASSLEEVDPDLAEDLWQVYAWPVRPDLSGPWVFHVGIDGVVRHARMPVGPDSGSRSGPSFDAALMASRPGDLASPVAYGAEAVDGLDWKVFR